ncbi:MAG: menaquinone-dependent protoporphyrinogen oxidase [Gaiellaceae bacterium]|jgi:menaquinone-dependent protoporphyrinogen oxidase|nr:menaquinone-dependent protoporphyrinogen oxidase [Gaiellaceae bacterium]
MRRTLVAYASKHGSTEEVARAIGARLRDGGQDVDIRDAAIVTDVAPYDVVVLGGSLYMGRWHADARVFLRHHRAALEERLLAVFALGSRTLDEHDVADSRRQLDNALERLDIHPNLVTMFGGVIEPAKLRFPLNRMPQSDARDWAAIGAWAGEVSTQPFDSRQTEPV